jgi:hypothetical protein
MDFALTSRDKGYDCAGSLRHKALQKLRQIIPQTTALRLRTKVAKRIVINNALAISEATDARHYISLSTQIYLHTNLFFIIQEFPPTIPKVVSHAFGCSSYFEQQNARIRDIKKRVEQFRIR